MGETLHNPRLLVCDKGTDWTHPQVQTSVDRAMVGVITRSYQNKTGTALQGGTCPVLYIQMLFLIGEGVTV